ncbi:MAG TPA: hypothetical protein VFD58_13435 [Blastocatellia bacterium]|nr:hypothetical protein [Blastocatellia bacterium]
MKMKLRVLGIRVIFNPQNQFADQGKSPIGFSSRLVVAEDSSAFSGAPVISGVAVNDEYYLSAADLMNVEPDYGKSDGKLS